MSDPHQAAGKNALHPDDVMFSSAVRAKQESLGSREAQAHRAAAGRFARELSAEAVAFIGDRDSAYLATASADGQPYVQHRGGPKGFLKVLDARTIAIPEYPGNRQYISIGHLEENGRSFLFLMDYANARRLKLWGRGRLTDEPALLALFAAPVHPARVERVIVFSVLACDWNCSQHIPRLVPAAAAV